MATSLFVHGACPHDCPDTCGIVTKVQDGKAVGFKGASDHPFTQGWLCAKVRPYLEHVYHPDRLLHPLRRVGPKGGGQWQRISWLDAVAEIAQRWKRIIKEHGGEAILPYSYSGTLGLLQMTVSSGRFWNRLGASQLLRSICGAAAEYAVESTLGSRQSPPWSEVVHSKLVILWGHNPVSTGPHFLPFLKQAQRRGCRLVVIDPRRTPSARSADMHLTPLPGTDGYLALGIANWLVAHNLHDEDWLNAHAVGWPELKARLADFPLERAAAKTDIPLDSLERLARWYGELKPGLIKIADGINRNRNGGQNVRTICCLPALTGQYGVPGGGLSYSNSGYLQWDRQAVHKILPNTRTVNMNRLGAALLGEVSDPPIRSLYVFGANPATSSPNTAKIIAGLRKDSLFTVVHDLFLTDTADYADIVLPATSQLEHVDLHKSYGHTLLTYNHQALAPLGECKSNWEVMGLLARAMGFEEPWLHQKPDEVIREVLEATARHNPYLAGITLEHLKKEPAVPLAISQTPFAGGTFPTPSGKVELFSKRMADAGLDPLPGNFVEEAPSKDENGKRSNGRAQDALRLVTGASHHFVSSSLASQANLLKSEGVPFLEIHPDDARDRDITSGDWVRVENERGECQLQAVVTDSTRKGVVISPKGRWAKLSGGRHVNWTTSDTLGDMGGQSTFHSNFVWIRRAAKESV